MERRYMWTEGEKYELGLSSIFKTPIMHQNINLKVSFN